MKKTNMGVKLLIGSSERGYYINKNGDVFFKNKRRKVNYDAHGYARFGVKDERGKVISVMVHRLQAYQKYGDRIFEKGIQVRHLDNDCKNNNWDNIGIGTQSENMMDIPPEKRKERGVHAASYNIKHDAVKIKNDYSTGEFSYRDLMKKYDISSKGTMSHIINKR